MEPDFIGYNLRGHKNTERFVEFVRREGFYIGELRFSPDGSIPRACTGIFVRGKPIGVVDLNTFYLLPDGDDSEVDRLEKLARSFEPR